MNSILHADAIVLISDFYDNEVCDKKNLLFIESLKEKVPDLFHDSKIVLT